MWTATRKATRILTVSEASKRDILRFFDIPPEKVSVIYNAIDARFLGPADHERMDLVRQRYQLDHPFVLYVGNIKRHKNVERLIDAFAPGPRRRARRSALDHHRRRDLEAPRAATGRAPAPSRQARPIPRLPAARDAGGLLPARARVRLPVALRGLRPAAARSHGVRHAGRHLERLVAARRSPATRRCWSTRTTSTPSPTAFARAVTDESLRADLIARGLARARTFSWAQSVAKIHKIYMEVLAR